jgi:hypothetical protein
MTNFEKCLFKTFVVLEIEFTPLDMPGKHSTREPRHFVHCYSCYLHSCYSMCVAYIFWILTSYKYIPQKYFILFCRLSFHSDYFHFCVNLVSLIASHLSNFTFDICAFWVTFNFLEKCGTFCCVYF